MLGGLAIVVGFGVGVLVSSPASPPPASPPSPAHTAAVVRAGAEPPRASASAVQPAARSGHAGDQADAGLGDAGSTVATTHPPADTVQRLVAAQRAALAKLDRQALAGSLSPTVFGFGIDASEVAEGRDAVAAQLVRDLGEPPAGGFTVQSKALAIAEHRNSAWIAEELAVAAAGRAPRRLAVTQLAVVLDGRWSVVALHWAQPVDDATAERRAILGTLPSPRPIADQHDGSDELDRVVRAAFASRAGFVEARSQRPDAFNVGSGGERGHGGDAIKRLFGKLKAQIRLRGGARVVAGSAWDPAQRTDPWIGWSAVNVDFVSKTRAATEVTQTMRVLAIWLKDESGWKIVQTQWSNGGPIH